MDPDNPSRNGGAAYTVDAPEPARVRDRWMMRLVVIPLLIVGVCTGVALLFTAMVGRTPTPSERLGVVRAGGPNEKWQAAAALVDQLQSKPGLLEDVRFQGEVLAAFRESEGDDVRMRQFLAEILGMMRLTEAVPQLKAALKDPGKPYVVQVLNALALIGSASAYDAIEPYAHLPDPQLRKLAYFALGRIKDAQAIPILEEGLRDQEFQVHTNAVFALANFDDRRVLAELPPLLDRGVLARNGFKGGQSVGAGDAVDDMEPILTNALTVAAHFKDVSLRPVIERLRSSDPNPRVQGAAAEALAQLDRPAGG